MAAGTVAIIRAIMVDMAAIGVILPGMAGAAMAGGADSALVSEPRSLDLVVLA